MNSDWSPEDDVQIVAEEQHSLMSSQTMNDSQENVSVNAAGIAVDARFVQFCCNLHYLR